MCCFLALPSFIHAQDQPPQTSPHAVKKGTFLIAHPSLQDPNFQRTVILICEHGDEGTLGIVLNRPTDVRVSDVLPNISILKGTSYLLHEGGPVQSNNVLMLFRIIGEKGGLRPILDHVYLGVDRQLLERIITKPEPTETFRAYAGYAGWAPGQLDFEMAMGSWMVTGADPASIFDKDPETLWEEIVEQFRAPRVIRHGL